MEFYELIIDRTTFNQDWHKTNKCGFCEKKLNISEEQYRLKGNICLECTAKINKKHKENMDMEMKQRKLEKQAEMNRLGSRLGDEITEEERVKIVDKMMKLHTEIKTYEAHHED